MKNIVKKGRLKRNGYRHSSMDLSPRDGSKPSERPFLLPFRLHPYLVIMHQLLCYHVTM